MLKTDLYSAIKSEDSEVLITQSSQQRFVSGASSFVSLCAVWRWTFWTSF